MQKTYSLEKEKRITELTAEIGQKYEYKIFKVEVSFVSRKDFPDLSQVSADSERNLTVDVYWTDEHEQSIENVINDVGMKIARQYYHDDPTYGKIIKKAKVFGPIFRKLLDRDSRKSFEDMGKDIIERSRLYDQNLESQLFQGTS